MVSEKNPAKSDAEARLEKRIAKLLPVLIRINKDILTIEQALSTKDTDLSSFYKIHARLSERLAMGILKGEIE